MADSRCCMAETNTTLKSNHTPKKYSTALSREGITLRRLWLCLVIMALLRKKGWGWLPSTGETNLKIPYGREQGEWLSSWCPLPWVVRAKHPVFPGLWKFALSCNSWFQVVALAFTWQVGRSGECCFSYSMGPTALLASTYLTKRCIVGLRSRATPGWRMLSCTSGLLLSSEGFILPTAASWQPRTGNCPQQKIAASPKFMPLPRASGHPMTGWIRGTTTWGPCPSGDNPEGLP